MLEGCAYLESVGATALVGVGMTLDNLAFLVGKVFIGDEGSLEVSTEPEARAGEPLPRHEPPRILRRLLRLRMEP